MIITGLWHSRFLIRLESGYRIVTDPFDPSCGYPVGAVTADAVLVSHHHHDHDAVDTLSGNPQVIDYAGEHTLTPDVKVFSVRTWHDDAQGAKRGGNLVHILQAEGLRVVHLGDLGHELTEEQAEAIGVPDVLMIPVGGFFTIDAKTAAGVVARLQPKVVLPMHFRTAYNAEWPIAPADEFLQLMGGGAEWPECLRITAADLECQPRLAVLQPKEDDALKGGC